MSTLSVGPHFKRLLWSRTICTEGEFQEDTSGKTIEQEVILLFKLITKTQTESPTNNSIVLSSKSMEGRGAHYSQALF